MANKNPYVVKISGQYAICVMTPNSNEPYYWTGSGVKPDRLYKRAKIKFYPSQSAAEADLLGVIDHIKKYKTEVVPLLKESTMKNLNEAVDRVARGEHAEQILEKAITNANYDQRLAVNSPTTVQRGNITTNPEGFAEDHGETFDCPADYGVYPMAGARMWPRGSHESNAQKGEPPSFRSEDLVAKVASGESPKKVLEDI